MTTNGNGKLPQFWDSISLEDIPANGWQKLQVVEVNPIQSSDELSWLQGDQLMCKVRCMISEGQHQGTYANLDLQIGAYTGTARATGASFTISEDASVSTCLGQIGRILDLAHSGKAPPIESPTQLRAKFQAVCDTLDGSEFFADVYTNDSGFTQVKRGAKAIRGVSNPPEVFKSAVPEGFNA